MNGGWFASTPIVQVRNNRVWIPVTPLSVTPAYPASAAARGQTYTFNLPDTSGDGIRVIAGPGGAQFYTSIDELEVFYR